MSSRHQRRQPHIIDLTNESDEGDEMEDIGIDDARRIRIDENSRPDRPQANPAPPPLSAPDMATHGARPERQNVIDLDALPEDLTPGSPEVQFTFARQLAPPRGLPRLRFQPYTNPPRAAVDHYLATPDVELGLALQTGSPGAYQRALERFQAAPFAWVNGVRRMVAPVPRDADWSERLQMSMATRLAAHHEQELRERAIGRIDMDYDLIALGDGPLRPAPAPRAPPTYEAPEPAREGYTRSPDQADMCVCPNCGDELGKGETEEKRSVFFVKACGHVRFHPPLCPHVTCPETDQGSL